MKSNEKYEKQRRVRLWLGFLVLATCVFVIRLTWPTVDTIYKTIELRPPMEISLSGTVKYTDGTPLPYQTVEFHSTVRSTKTDEKGWFFFHRVETGEHEVFVVNEDGTTLASCPVEIREDADLEVVRIKRLTNGGYEIEVPVTTLLVEIEIILDRETGVITISGVRAIGKDGSIYTERERIAPVAGEVYLTPNDNEVLPDGTVHLSNGWVLLNDGTLIKPDGTVITPDGTEHKITTPVTLENGTVFDPVKGEVITPGGSIIRFNTGEITPGTTTPEGNDPQGTVPGDSGSGSTTIPGISGVIDGIHPGDPSGPNVVKPAPGGLGDPILPGQSDQNPPSSGGSTGGGGGGSSKPHPELIVYDKDISKPWTQTTEVEIFSAEYKNGEQTTVRSDNGDKVVAPGTKGSYVFTVLNKGDVSLRYEVKPEAILSCVIDGVTYEVPMEAKFYENSLLTGGWFSMKELADHTFSGTLQVKKSNKYTLDWRWPYEGNDAMDTALGNLAAFGGEGELKVVVRIHVTASYGG